MADHNSGESFAAFLLGGIIGGALGLLLAPRKGTETRKTLLDWIEENRERTERFLDGEGHVLEEQKEKLQAAWKAGKKAYEGGNGD